MVDSDIPENTDPILGFHDIGDHFDWTLNVLPVERLQSIVSLKEIGALNPGYLFDDGYVCLIEESVGHLLQPFKRWVSIITQAVGGSNTWDTRPGGGAGRHLDATGIRKLAESNWTVLSHTCTHRALTILPAKEQLKELRDSREELEQITGREVTGLSFPFGRFNHSVIELAKDCGYQQFFSNRYQTSEVRRVLSVYRWDSNQTILKKLNHHPAELSRLWLINTCSSGTIAVQSIKQLLTHE